MNVKKHVFWEVLLIIGSVFVFRGLWNLMDKSAFLASSEGLAASLAIGLLIVGLAFYVLNRHY